MKHIHISFIFIIISFFSTYIFAQDPLPYKGLHVPPMPTDHESIGGYLINSGSPTEYAISEVWFGKKKMWWLKKMISRNKKGKALWEVTAVKNVPKIPKGFYFLMGLCEKDGNAVPEIIAAAKREDKEKLTKIHKAWIVNLKAQSIDSHPTPGIVCINEGFGL